MKYIETNLSYLRAIRKLTQREIAQATGIGQKTLSALETGTSQGIEFNTLAKLCTFFRCEPSDILLIEEHPDNTPPSLESLKRADAIVKRGLKAAMDSTKSSGAQSTEDVWAEFDAMRKRLQKSSAQLTLTDEKRGRARA
jgi:putative transcriptional regulator